MATREKLGSGIGAARLGVHGKRSARNSLARALPGDVGPRLASVIFGDRAGCIEKINILTRKGGGRERPKKGQKGRIGVAWSSVVDAPASFAVAEIYGSGEAHTEAALAGASRPRLPLAGEAESHLLASRRRGRASPLMETRQRASPLIPAKRRPP